MNPLTLTPAERAKLIQQGLIQEPTPPSKGGRPRKVTHIIAPTGPTFKSTPGPAQGVEYRSPYRHVMRGGK